MEPLPTGPLRCRLRRRSGRAAGRRLCDNVIRLLREAYQRARENQRQRVTSMDLLISLLTASNSIVADCFARIGVTPARLTELAVMAEQHARPA